LLVLLATLCVGGSIWVVARTQGAAAIEQVKELEAADAMLVSALDQEHYLNTYIRTRDRADFEAYTDARADFKRAAAAARAGAGGEDEELKAIATQADLQDRWHRAAGEAIGFPGSGEQAKGAPAAIVSFRRDLHTQVTQFREANDEVTKVLQEERETGDRSANLLTALLASGLLCGGFLIFELRARTERRRRERQVEFGELMQVTHGEAEAYGLLKRHLDRSIRGARAIVMNRNNSADQLRPTTTVEADSPIAPALLDARPDSCMAIRLGRAYARSPAGETIMQCEICGRSPERTTCVPSLVGGEIMGSVLVERRRALGGRDLEDLRRSVSEAAPIVANHRTLAIAELRAATDVLTGLPNTRALRDHLKQLVAQSGRTGSSLSVILFDLDRFKEINDVWGHDKGDQVLAAVGEAARGSIRESDIVGRQGGEEFLVLCPATTREGAAALAEKIRASIALISVAGVERSITASLGVAALPEDASDGDELLRAADRAMYEAKSHGRNRVETTRGLTTPDDVLVQGAG